MSFRRCDQNQAKFGMLINYRDMLSNDHPAVVINDIVEYIDTSMFEDRYSKEGNPAYDPNMMLKLLIYGYHQGYFGGRPIFNHFQTDLGLRYLTNDDFPDHRTINEFRVKFKEEIVGVFAQVVLLCEHSGLIGFEDLAIDSQKLKANANLFQNKNLKSVKRELKRIEKKVNKLLEEDIESEDEELKRDKKIASYERRKKKLQDAAKILKEMGGEDDDSIRYNLTDPESTVMKDKTGAVHPDYMCQNAVDSKQQVITALKVTNQPSDKDELEPMKDLSKKNTGRPHNHTMADCGYSEKVEYTRMESDLDTDYYVPDQTLRSSKKDPYSKWNFEYVEEHDVYICPQNRPVNLARVIITPDGREICVYEAEDCSSCPVRDKCLKGSDDDGASASDASHNRTITIYPEDELIKEMRAKLDSEEGKKIYQQRQITVEPVHGDMQKNRNFIQFFLRGLEKVNVEYHLLGTAHNVRKIILHGLDSLRNLFKSGNSTPGFSC